jgi:hypothetical protein
MISTVVEAIKLFGLLKSFAILAAALAALGITYVVWHHQVYQSGVNDTYAKIARDDAAAVGRASKMRDQYTTCADRGGAWDQTTGRCR